MFVRSGVRGTVKDHLRNVRFVARELKDSVHQVEHGGSAGLIHPAAALAGAIADFSDRKLTRLGSIVLGMVSSDPGAYSGPPPLYPLDHYLGRAGSAKQQEFARHLYAAAKHILLRQGAGNPNISEVAFGQAYLQAASAPALAAAERATLHTSCLAAAAVTSAILATRPINAPAVVVDNEAGTIHDANLFVASVLGLALAVASVDEDVGPDDAVYDSAAVAVTIRYATIEAATAGDDAVAQLSAIYAQLAPHLP